MKWFKHMCNAIDDDFIEWMEEEYGMEGLGRWWRILETIGRPLEKDCMVPSAEHSWQKWQFLLRGKRSVLLRYLVAIQQRGKIEIEYNDNILKITCIKMLKYRDEHTSKSGVTKSRTPLQIPLEIEIEIEKDNPLSPLAWGKRAQLDLIESPPAEKPPRQKPPTAEPERSRFDEFYEVYPKKRDRQRALKSYETATGKATQQEIINGARHYAAECESDTRPTAQQFIKHPATWLNGQCWENYADAEFETDFYEMTDDQKIKYQLAQAGLV